MLLILFSEVVLVSVQMETYPDEVSVQDYMRLMKAFWDGRTDAEEYTRSCFDLSKKRVNIADEEANRITQQAYGDADDYEPDVELRRRNPQWIDEPTLRGRVANSLRELEALGYRIEKG